MAIKNYGKATIKVETYDSLPGVLLDGTETNKFEFLAFSWPNLLKSSLFKPVLVDNVTDVAGGFSACFPSKRRFMVSNILINNGISSPPYVSYGYSSSGSGGSSGGGSGGLGSGITSFSGGSLSSSTTATTSRYDCAITWQPLVDSGSLTGSAKLELEDMHVSNVWSQIYHQYIAPPNDYGELAEWYTKLSSSGAGVLSSGTGSASASSIWTGVPPPQSDPVSETGNTIGYIHQDLAQEDTWYGLESCAFLNENMPFWLHVQKAKAVSSNYEFKIIVQLGVNKPDHNYDIIMTNNKKLMIVDWYKRRDVSPTDLPPYEMQEFPLDNENINEETQDIMLGFQIIAGRLVIYVNGFQVIYQRINRGITDSDEKGTLDEVKISDGSIRFFGCNSILRVNASPMTFAEMGVMIVPTAELAATLPAGGSTAIPSYRGIKADGTYSGSMAKIPNAEDPGNFAWGVDCYTFEDASGTVWPLATWGQKHGYMLFKKVSNSTTIGSGFWGSGFSSPTTLNDKSMVLAMKPDNKTITCGSCSQSIKYAGCPYFFILKGGHENINAVTPTSNNISANVVSASVEFSAPDYSHYEGKATVVLYNKGGTYDSILNSVKGIRIEFALENGTSPGASTRVFTGMVISATPSEVAGMETITLQCEDYMFILNSVPIFNSPYFDGAFATAAIQELIKAGGINTFSNDMIDGGDTYFLPTGGSLTSQAVRFEATQKILECVLSIAKRFEAVFYFDENGEFHIEKLTGGLFGTPIGASYIEYVRDPNGDNVILDQKNYENSFRDTVSMIIIITADRANKGPIVWYKRASTNKINFRKPLLIDQAALGAYKVAEAWGTELANRVFHAIDKISFKTAYFATDDSDTATIVRPLHYIKVDGETFRVTGVSAKYDSTNNSLVADINAEWLGVGGT